MCALKLPPRMMTVDKETFWTGKTHLSYQYEDCLCKENSENSFSHCCSSETFAPEAYAAFFSLCPISSRLRKMCAALAR